MVACDVVHCSTLQCGCAMLWHALHDPTQVRSSEARPGRALLLPHGCHTYYSYCDYGDGKYQNPRNGCLRISEAHILERGVTTIPYHTLHWSESLCKLRLNAPGWRMTASQLLVSWLVAESDTVSYALS
eukprot:6191171-Pleurochrysis_carterae.AAC.2